VGLPRQTAFVIVPERSERDRPAPLHNALEVGESLGVLCQDRVYYIDTSGNLDEKEIDFDP